VIMLHAVQLEAVGKMGTAASHTAGWLAAAAGMLEPRIRMAALQAGEGGGKLLQQ
jgi:hypothetical protein